MMFTYDPRDPQRRRPIRQSFEKNYHSDNSLQELYTKDDICKQQRRSVDRIDGTTRYKNQDQYNYSDEQITDEDTDDELEELPSNHSQRRSRTNSPQRTQNSYERFKESPEPHSTEQNTNSSYNYLLIFVMFIAIPIIVFLVLNIKEESINKKQLHSANNASPVSLNSIEYIRTKFRNQDSDIWNDISSGINEVLTRTPKVPSIILLFANETTTMNCLASALGRVSSAILGGDNPLHLNPEDFGDDPGEIINILKVLMPVKNAVVIYDVLNINTDAIKALHNLCDRINPLIGETIYIITMKTKNYESSQKLAFIEKQIYYKLSTKIDQDILMALIVRMTDGIIISVQPETNLQYC